MDWEQVQEMLASTYWSPGISLEKVMKAARGSSLVIGAFVGGVQVGYTRIVSDETTFAWVCDVFVDEAHRGQGIAQAMVARALADPDHQNMRRWILATRDAHRVYEKLGFKVLQNPTRWMFYGTEVVPDSGASK